MKLFLSKDLQTKLAQFRTILIPQIQKTNAQKQDLQLLLCYPANGGVKTKFAALPNVRDETRLTCNCAHLRWTKESLTIEFGKKMCKKLFFHKVSDVFIVTIGRYWLIHDVSGSVWDSAG